MVTVLKRVYIHNYKCLVGFDLELQNTTLLLGGNGAGKTAVLEVLFALRKLLAGEARIDDEIAFHPSSLTKWQAEPHQVFELETVVGGESFAYRLEIEHDEDGRRSRITEESLVGNGTTLFRFDHGEVKLFRDDGSEGPTFAADWTESALARVVPQSINTRLSAFKDAIGNMVVCTIYPHELRAFTDREDRYLGRYADNFVDWYRHAVQENPRLARAHVEALRPVMDGFYDVHLQQAGLDTRVLMLDFVTATGEGRAWRYRLRFDKVSDGQRALVVLYALLHLGQDGKGLLLVIDEPDNYLSLPEIQPWLMELVDLCEETPSQAVICSHHPELIDYLGPDCGLVLRREASGVTTARPPAASLSDVGLKLSELVARGWESRAGMSGSSSCARTSSTKPSYAGS